MDVIREVTQDKNYVGFKMADNDYKMPINDKKQIKDKKEISELKHEGKE